ncbi:hypothetical protein [Halopelagius longus]|uniref:Uncharacterized protein n=1 Tax=Halopelagius longus TaxID=1236180 RepID=A0A1H1DN31_9EURY|nr:hypothetical protein [Halopelagius longus]RDI71401.1 hypothetical protein DWB78_06490 [Halopelagius longus]SDQ77944.1 hypothetical protein SAMN05216278_2496 [Halopelagius longus]
MEFAPLLLVLVGLAGFLRPERTLRFSFLGSLTEGASTERGLWFFRGLGLLCVVSGAWMALFF